MKYRYKYSGPAMIFDQVAARNWSGETVAVNEKKAMVNLGYQFKKDAKLRPTARVTLFPAYLKVIESVM